MSSLFTTVIAAPMTFLFYVLNIAYPAAGLRICRWQKSNLPFSVVIC